MTGDITIPKKTVSSFMTGVFVTLMVLFLLGGALAATVYYIGANNAINAGGGTVTNLGSPVASSDAATKGYVDAAGKTLKIQTFTSNGTWTWTSGVSEVWVSMVGGGGGGGGNGGTTSGGGGGQGGQSTTRYPVAVSGDMTVIVGAGGAGGTNIAPQGPSGTNSSFGSLTVRGGIGGTTLTPGSVNSLSNTFGAPGGSGGSGHVSTDSGSGCMGTNGRISSPYPVLI